MSRRTRVRPSDGAIVRDLCALEFFLSPMRPGGSGSGDPLVPFVTEVVVRDPNHVLGEESFAKGIEWLAMRRTYLSGKIEKRIAFRYVPNPFLRSTPKIIIPAKGTPIKVQWEQFQGDSGTSQDDETFMKRRYQLYQSMVDSSAINIKTGPLWAVRALYWSKKKSQDGQPSTLCFYIMNFHGVDDGRSATRIADDIIKAAVAHASGTPLVTPKPLGFTPALRPRQNLKWFSIVRCVPHALDYSKKVSGIPRAMASLEIEQHTVVQTRSLTKEASAALLQHCRQVNATVQGCLIHLAAQVYASMIRPAGKRVTVGVGTPIDMRARASVEVPSEPSGSLTSNVYSISKLTSKETQSVDWVKVKEETKRLKAGVNSGKAEKLTRLVGVLGPGVLTLLFRNPLVYMRKGNTCCSLLISNLGVLKPQINSDENNQGVKLSGFTWIFRSKAYLSKVALTVSTIDGSMHFAVSCSQQVFGQGNCKKFADLLLEALLLASTTPPDPSV